MPHWVFDVNAGAPARHARKVQMSQDSIALRHAIGVALQTTCKL